MDWTKVCDVAVAAKDRGDFSAVISALEQLQDANEVHHVMYWLRITAIADHSKGQWVAHSYPDVPPYWKTPVYRPKDGASKSELINWAKKWLPLAIEQDSKKPIPSQLGLFDIVA